MAGKRRRRSRRSVPPDSRGRTVPGIPEAAGDRSSAEGSLPVWARVGLGVLVALLYASSTARDMLRDDSVELLLVGATGSIPHPTGYPLFSMVSGVVCSVLPPVAALAGIIVSSLVLVVFLLASVLEDLGLDSRIAHGVALLFAVSREVWIQAVVPEVYGFHLLLVIATIKGALALRRDPGTPWARWFPVVLGLSWTHHLQSVFLIPALLVLLWPVLSPHVAGRILLGSLPCLSLYLWLPVASLRNPPLAWGEPHTPGAFLDHVTGSQFAYRMQGELADPAGEVREVVVNTATQLDGWGLMVMCGLGLALRGAIRFRDRVTLLLVLAGALTGLTALLYEIPDKEAYFLVPYLAITLLAGRGMAGPGMATVPGVNRPAPVLLPGILLGATLGLALWRWPRVERTDDRALRILARDLQRGVEGEEALLVVEDLSLYMADLYRREVEGAPGTVRVVSLYLARLPWYLRQLSRQHPGLSVPEAVIRRLERHEARGFGRGLDAGKESQRVARETVARLVIANRDRMPVYWLPHRFAQPEKAFPAPAYDFGTGRWDTGAAFALGDAGLFQQILPVPAPDRPRPLRLTPASAGVTTEHSRRSMRSLARRYATTCNRQGIIRLEAGDRQGARDVFEQGLEYDPGYGAIHTNLGVLHSSPGGDGERARHHFRRSLVLDPDGPRAEAIRRALAGTSP